MAIKFGASWQLRQPDAADSNEAVALPAVYGSRGEEYIVIDDAERTPLEHLSVDAAASRWNEPSCTVCLFAASLISRTQETFHPGLPNHLTRLFSFDVALSLFQPF